jgi:hypothetical protein
MPETAPNLYQLTGRQLHITYSTSGVDGKPHFSYQDAQQSHDFAGDEIRVVECDLGSVVSVYILRTFDSGSTSFSLFVPKVGLVDGAPQTLHTQGVTTIHKFSILPPFNVGQKDLYHVASLHGTAANVVF